MRKLKYSPDAAEKLQEIKNDITVSYGSEKAKTIIEKMTKSFRDLQQFGNKGPSVECLIGIPGDYRFLYVQHNYVFYRVDGNTIWITDIYNEKEHFMRKLFGIKATTQETERFWNE